jgi:hypothetical protein
MVSKYPIFGVNKEDVALTCIGRGYLPWIAANGETLYVPTLFSPDAADTIISPTDVVMSYAHLYNAWAQFSHCSSVNGTITFYQVEGTNHTTYPYDSIMAFGSMMLPYHARPHKHTAHYIRNLITVSYHQLQNPQNIRLFAD